MKKVLVLTVLLAVFIAAMTGCFMEKTTEHKSTEKPLFDVDQVTFDTEEIAYKEPVEAISIDLSSADPSNSQIQFSYDESNRIKQCNYSVDGHSINVVYTYSGNEAHIYAFSDDYLAAEEVFTVNSYDSTAGFTSNEGYYFCGCVF